MRTIIARFNVEENELLISKLEDLIRSNKGKITNSFTVKELQKEVNANITIGFKDAYELMQFEDELKNYFDYNLKILTDTREYWDNDPNFRKLANTKKEANRKLDDYINKLKLKK